MALPSAALSHVPPSKTRQRPFWRSALEPYEQPSVSRGLIDVATSLVPYVVLSVVMYLLLPVSYLLVLAVGVVAAGCLLRTYIVFHDCTHGSFLPSKRANTWLGVISGLLVFSPFHAWKHEHAVHHASSSDLDRRGTGDVDMMTVREYREGSLLQRFGYRFVRNPVVMLGLGPIWALAIQPRFAQGTGRPLDRRSVVFTDIALVVIIALLVWLIGWRAYLAVQLPTVMLAGGAGVFMFYVQHQFEGTYWEHAEGWSYADAALKGASYLRLPKVLQFFSGNIGFHHVHHLSARIPNYNLERAHRDHEFLQTAPTLSLWDGIRALRLKLWDEDSRRLVTFAEARAAAA